MGTKKPTSVWRLPFISVLGTVLLGILLSSTLSAQALTMKFKETDIRNILQFFSSELELNIVVAPEVSGIVDYSINNLPPEQALTTLLDNQNLNWEKKDGIFHVYADPPYKVYTLKYISAEDVKNTLGYLLPTKNELSVSETQNLIVAKGTPPELVKITDLINELDVPPLQVLVEVKILEMTNGQTDIFGIGVAMDTARNEAVNFKGFANTADLGTEGVFVQVFRRNLQGLFESLEKETDVNVVSTPKMLVLNNKTASILTGEKFGYRINTYNDTGNIIGETVDFLEVGTQLTFTPMISRDGTILMDIDPEISEGSITNGLPQASTTETSTHVMVKDGQTILIGGLIRNKKTIKETRVPILSRIPLIKRLFKRKETVVEKIETAIFITPHLVTKTELDSLQDAQDSVETP